MMDNFIFVNANPRLLPAPTLVPLQPWCGPWCSRLVPGYTKLAELVAATPELASHIIIANVRLDK